jgi:hypothetical protein
MVENNYGIKLDELLVQARSAGKANLALALEGVIAKEKAGEDVQGSYDRLAACYSCGEDMLTISPAYLLDGTVEAE